MKRILEHRLGIVVALAVLCGIWIELAQQNLSPWVHLTADGLIIVAFIVYVAGAFRQK